MVASKMLGKSNAGGFKIAEGRAASKNVATKFKIYSDNEKVAAPGCDIVNATRTGKSVLAMKESTEINANCLRTKGHTKDVQKHGSNCDTLAKVNSQRKALSDLSNVQGRFCRNEVHGGPNLVVKKGRSDTLTREEEKKVQLAEVVAFKLLTKLAPELQVPVQISKGLGFRSAKLIKMPSVPRMLIHLLGLLVQYLQGSNVRRESQARTGDVKGKIEMVDKGKAKHGFPVKPRIGGKMTSQASNVKSKLWKDRFSDGILLMAATGESEVDACERSRRSTKKPDVMIIDSKSKSLKLNLHASHLPIVKTNLRASNARRTSKSNCSYTFDKSLHAISYGKTKVKRSFVSESTNFKVPCKEATQGGRQAQCSDNSKQKLLDITARKTSDRRRSYTSLLMRGSKLLEGTNKVMKQEEIPSIDDESDPLEVAEYVDDIYQYYWFVEAESTSLENYLTTQRYVTPQMRGILINWLIEVHVKFDLMPETLYLTIALLDRYLSLVTIHKNQMQLVGLTSFLLASKYEDFWHPRIKDLISISAESYTRKEMLEMEKNILKKLKFRLNLPTVYVFMLRFLKASQSSKKVEHLAFYLIELCLVEYGALKFRPSLLCASAIYVARHTLQMIPAWTPLLVKHTHYDRPKIRSCAEMILRFHKAAGSGLLNVSHDKYKMPRYLEVATIKPLDSLPA